MIAFENISKSFGNQVILDRVSSTFQANKINLVIGKSGSGKSILVKCLVDLIRPDQGKVFFDQQDLFDGPLSQKLAIKKDIGMLFQGCGLFDSKTIGENVQFPLDVHTNLSRAEKKDRVLECLEHVGLPGITQKMPNELSGGMKKRVGIARAIVHRPKYLFCDEPTSGLDPQTALKIDDLICQTTHSHHMTTIVITHDINTILSLGDFILFLHQGSIAWQGTSEQLRQTTFKDLQEFVFVGNFSKLLCR